MTKLLDERAPDEAGGARDQHLHGRRVYWRACALLAVVLLAGCDHGKKRSAPPPPPPPPAPKLSFFALDRMHQRLVADYEPVSRALTAYQIAFREWRLGQLSQGQLLSEARSFRTVVVRARSGLRTAPASGETVRTKRLWVRGLTARAAALAALPDLDAYVPLWNRSEIDARAGLSIMQDIRDEARLIPIPEDAVS